MNKVIKNITTWVRAVVGPAEIVFSGAEAEPLPREVRLEILKVLQDAQSQQDTQGEDNE